MTSLLKCLTSLVNALDRTISPENYVWKQRGCNPQDIYREIDDIMNMPTNLYEMLNNYNRDPYSVSPITLLQKELAQVKRLNSSTHRMLEAACNCLEEVKSNTVRTVGTANFTADAIGAPINDGNLNDLGETVVLIESSNISNLYCGVATKTVLANVSAGSLIVDAKIDDLTVAAVTTMSFTDCSDTLLSTLDLTPLKFLTGDVTNRSGTFANKVSKPKVKRRQVKTKPQKQMELLMSYLKKHFKRKGIEFRDVTKEMIIREYEIGEIGARKVEREIRIPKSSVKNLIERASEEFESEASLDAARKHFGN
jgi:hypothetical protein